MFNLTLNITLKEHLAKTADLLVTLAKSQI